MRHFFRSALLASLAIALPLPASAELAYQGHLERGEWERLDSLRFDSADLEVTPIPPAARKRPELEWQAKIKGVYHGKKRSWILTAGGFTRRSEEADATQFEFEVPLAGTETKLTLTEIDPSGDTRSESAKIFFSGQPSPAFRRFRPALFEISEFLGLQSEGRSAYAPMFAWSPVVNLTRRFFARGRLGATSLRYSVDDGRFWLLSGELSAGLKWREVWSLEAGVGLQNWRSPTGGTYATFGASVARSFEPKLLYVLDGVFFAYSHAFVPTGDAQEFLLGVRLGWK